MKKLFLMFVGVGVFLTIVGYFTGPFSKNKFPLNQGSILRVNDRQIAVEIADSEEERKQGLSGREDLPRDNGMLFVFPEGGRPVFWMKDMKFAIDIIWIKDSVVIGIEKNVPAEPGVGEQSLKVYRAPENINYVLEVRSGVSDEYGIKVGSTVTLPSSLTK